MHCTNAGGSVGKLHFSMSHLYYNIMICEFHFQHVRISSSDLTNQVGTMFLQKAKEAKKLMMNGGEH